MKSIQLSLLLKDNPIVNIYTGDESGCRCGCRGNYFTPGSKGFTRALNKAKDLNPVVDVFEGYGEELRKAIMDQQLKQHDGVAHAIATEDAGWIDISRGNGKTITLYWK